MDKYSFSEYTDGHFSADYEKGCVETEPLDLCEMPTNVPNPRNYGDPYPCDMPAVARIIWTDIYEDFEGNTKYKDSSMVVCEKHLREVREDYKSLEEEPE